MKERCNECKHWVHESDPYFATPCGTYCSDCMEEHHSKECGICASEFELNKDPFEADEKDQSEQVDDVNNSGKDTRGK